MLPRPTLFCLAAVLALGACNAAAPDINLVPLGTCHRADGGPFTTPTATQFTRRECQALCGPSCTWTPSSD